MESGAVAMPVIDRLAKAVSTFGVELASSTFGTLTQIWMPEAQEDGSLLLATQGMPFSINGSGDLLALFRCISCKYKFSINTTKPTTLGAVGRVYTSGEVEMSQNVQKYDQMVYPRVAEAQRCQIHSTLFLPIYDSPRRESVVAVFEVAQSQQNAVFAALIDWAKCCLGQANLYTSEIDKDSLPIGLKTPFAGMADFDASGLESGIGALAPNRNLQTESEQPGGYNNRSSAMPPPPPMSAGGALPLPLGLQNNRMMMNREATTLSESVAVGALGVVHEEEEAECGVKRDDTDKAFVQALIDGSSSHQQQQQQQQHQIQLVQVESAAAIHQGVGIHQARSADFAGLGDANSFDEARPAKRQAISTGGTAYRLLPPLPHTNGTATATNGGVIKPSTTTPLSALPIQLVNPAATSYGQGDRVLTIEDLKPTFGMSMKDAAAALGICNTTLKRACRKLGLPRWPRRDLQKMQAERLAQLRVPPTGAEWSLVSGDTISAGSSGEAALSLQQQQRQQPAVITVNAIHPSQSAPVALPTALNMQKQQSNGNGITAAEVAAAGGALPDTTAIASYVDRIIQQQQVSNPIVTLPGAVSSYDGSMGGMESLDILAAEYEMSVGNGPPGGFFSLS